jgi:hypothetical protein
MLNKIIGLNVVLLFAVYAIHADWQDDLAGALGATRRWNSTQVRSIIDHMRNYDHAQIKHLETRVKTAPAGLRGAISEAADKSNLSSVHSEHDEHKKIAHALEQLEHNARDRAKALHYILDLYDHKTELEECMAELENLKAASQKGTIAKKVKTLGKRAVENVEIAACKAKVARDKKRLKNFLLSAFEKNRRWKTYYINGEHRPVGVSNK